MRNRAQRVAAAIILVLACAAAWLFTAPLTDDEARNKTLVERLEHSSRTRLSHLWKAVTGRRTLARQAPAVKGTKSNTAPPRQTELRVIVLDDRLAPVKGARVELRSGTPVRIQSIESPSDGRLVLKVSPGSFEIRAHHPKYSPYTSRGVVRSSDATTLDIQIVLRGAAAVKGRIVDEDGRALAGVSINAERRRLEQIASDASTYVNDAAYEPEVSQASGEFLLSNMALGPNRLIFALEGFASSDLAIDVPAGGLKAPLQVVMRRPASISGQVVNEQQQPITSATIKVLAYRRYGEPDVVSTSTVSAISSTTGGFTLKHLLLGASYDLQVDHPTYATGIFPLVPADSHDQVWVLNRGGEISGRATVIDRPTTTARVLLNFQTILQGTTFTAQTMSNADGTWSVDRLPFGQYKIDVDHNGFVNEPRPPVNSMKDKPTTGVLVELYEALALRGKVIDIATDQPIPAAKVTASSSYGYYSTRSRSFTATSDDRGNFELPRLPGGSHAVIGKAEGYLPSNAGGSDLRISLRSNEPFDQLIIPMSRGGIIEGYVRGVDHEGLPDADVQLFVASTTVSSFPLKDLHAVSDGGGRFEIRGFPLSDRVQLYASASKPGYAKARSPLIELTAQTPRAQTNITLSAGGVIMGKVMDTAGRPLNLAKVTFESREFLGDPSPSSFSVRTGSDGVYILEHCTPGTMRVTASRNEFVPLVRSGIVREGVLLNKFDFKLLSATKIGGTVADFKGRPIAGARVTATPLEKATGYGSAVTDKHGEFTIGSLGQGFFRIEATFPLTTPDGVQNYTFIIPRVRTGTLGLPIDCDVEPTVRGTVDTDDGKRLDRFSISLRSQLDTNPPQQFRFNLERRLTSARGVFRVLQVPRGIYKLEINADGYEPYRSEDVIIGPGLTTTLPSIRLRSSSGIDGTVVSAASGSPVANVTIRVLDMAQPELITVNRLELGSYSRQDIVEYLDAWYDTNSDIDPNRLFRPIARVRANVASMTKTDYSGRFKVTGTPPGQYTLEFEHPSYSTLRMDLVSVTRTQATDVGEVQLRPGGELRGQVVDGQGRPVYSASVVVRGERQGRGSTRTDIGGNYLFRGIAPGQRTVVVRATVGGRSVYAYAFSEVREDESTPLNFILALDANINGTLSSPDTPVKSGTVRLYPLDENGAVLPDIHYDGTARGPAFSISGIPSGKYVTVATGNAAGSFALWQTMDVNRGENELSIPLGTATLSGIITSPSGASSAGVKVQLRPVLSGTSLPVIVYNLLVRSATSGSTGKFNLPYLPAGLYDIFYMPAGTTFPVPAGQVMLTPGQRLTGYRLEIP